MSKNTQTNPDNNVQVGSDETVTFQDVSKLFEATVKNSFLKVIPNPETYEIAVLIKDHRLPEYFHNPVGPALRRTEMDQSDPLACEYWLNGRMIDDPQVIAKMKHNTNFQKKFDVLLNT